MIKLFFQVQRDTYLIRISGKEIFYSDRKMKRETRVIPVDPELQKKIIMSRNRLPQNLLETFILTKEEEKEYSEATSEAQLAEICIKDCKKNNSILIKREVL